MQIFKNTLIHILSITLLLILFWGCSKKAENNHKKGSQTTDLLNSINESHEELNKAMEKVGYQDKEAVLGFLKDFKNTNDEVEKFKACLPISEALSNYEIRKTLNSEVPKFSSEEYSDLNNANEYCQWAGKMLDNFENELTEKDLRDISHEVDNSTIIYTKKVFSNRTTCTSEEYTKLLNINEKLYANPRIISAILILTSFRRDGNAGIYVPRYKTIIERKNPKHKELLFYFLDQIEMNTSTEAAVKLKKGSIAKTTQTLSELGVKDVEEFMKISLQTAPNCLSSISSGVMDISRIVATKKTMGLLHDRISKEIKKNKSLPVDKSEESVLKKLSTEFKNSLDKEKINYLDNWFRPILVKGDAKKFALISVGKDRKPFTKDDLIFPAQ